MPRLLAEGQGAARRRTWGKDGANAAGMQKVPEVEGSGGRGRAPSGGEREGKKRLEALENQERSLARPPNRKAAPGAAPLPLSTA
jgi:hypothetical protein